jgi:hypothetical protein
MKSNILIKNSFYLFKQLKAKHMFMSYMVYRICYGILNPLSMVYRSPYSCYIEPPPHGVSNPILMAYRTPYPSCIKPHIHGKSNPLPMVFWTTCPCFFLSTYPCYCEPLPTNGILNPYPWYSEPPTHGISNPLLWYYEPPLLIKMRRFILPWWGSKYHDRNLILGSKYHMVYWTRGQFFRGLKYHNNDTDIRILDKNQILPTFSLTQYHTTGIFLPIHIGAVVVFNCMVVGCTSS